MRHLLRILTFVLCFLFCLLYASSSYAESVGYGSDARPVLDDALADALSLQLAKPTPAPSATPSAFERAAADAFSRIDEDVVKRWSDSFDSAKRDSILKSGIPEYDDGFSATDVFYGYKERMEMLGLSIGDASVGEYDSLESIECDDWVAVYGIEGEKVMSATWTCAPDAPDAASKLAAFLYSFRKYREFYDKYPELSQHFVDQFRNDIPLLLAATQTKPFTYLMCDYDMYVGSLDPLTVHIILPTNW